MKRFASDVMYRALKIASGETLKDRAIYSSGVLVGRVIGMLIVEKRKIRKAERAKTENAGFEQLELDLSSGFPDVEDEDNMSERLSIKGEEVSHLEDVTYIIRDRGYITHSEYSDVEVNLVEDKEDNWDWEMELQSRSSSEPYIIHQDEYLENEFDFTQQTVIYYAEDNILADEDDTPLHNWQGLIGDLVFGHGSNDKNIVYIRNEKHHLEYEVLYDSGSYEKTVLRMEWDDQSYYEPKNGTSKFRDQDED